MDLDRDSSSTEAIPPEYGDHSSRPSRRGSPAQDQGEPHERRRYEVRGRVQGVGFRAWTIHRGRELGLSGTVRNRADGAVEVDAAGPRDALDRLELLLHRGPVFAAVTDVRRLEPSAEHLPSSFRIGG